MTAKRRRVIWVRWNDAYSPSHATRFADDFDDPDTRRLICESAGVLIKDDRHGVVMASQVWANHDLNDKPTGQDLGRGHLVIPKAYILKKMIF